MTRIDREEYEKLSPKGKRLLRRFVNECHWTRFEMSKLYIEIDRTPHLRRDLDQGRLHPDDHRLSRTSRDPRGSLLNVCVTYTKPEAMMILLQRGIDTNPITHTHPVVLLLEIIETTTCEHQLRRLLAMARLLKTAGTRLPSWWRLLSPTLEAAWKNPNHMTPAFREAHALFCANPLSLETLALHQIRDQLRSLADSPNWYTSIMDTSFMSAKEKFLLGAQQHNMLPLSTVRNLRATHMLAPHPSYLEKI